MAVIHDLSEIVKRLPPFLPITLEEVNKKTFSVDTCTHNVLNSGAHSRLFFFKFALGHFIIYLTVVKEI